MEGGKIGKIIFAHISSFLDDESGGYVKNIV